MRLPKPFYRLPVTFDVERLRAEVNALPGAAWVSHPNEIEGNSSVRLISAGGGENDDVGGEMSPTPHLRQCPYIRQVLASFGVVWSRSRLMRLAAGAIVPDHADINYHWFSRVRIHIPVITRPEVRFHCGDASVHMQAGEAWIFDNWRRHRVENPTDEDRVHLVADTSGTAAFWQFAAQGDLPGTAYRRHAYEPGRDVTPLTEGAEQRPVMPPSEVDLLALDLRAEVASSSDDASARPQVARYQALLDAFCRDWRQLYLLYGERPSGLAEYGRARDTLRANSRAAGEGLIARTNGVSLHTVLEGRILRHLVPLEDQAKARAPRTARARVEIERPTFIVSAPRAGSTLLFETLSATPQLATLGGEAHWLVEGFPELRPGAPGVDSNRLTAEHCSAHIAARIRDQIAERLASGRFLEKTPKNSLRIPFFDRVFPDARYIFLWRDPRQNLSSIMEAWRSGRYVTYPDLPDWDGPWSLLLPPGWQSLRGKPLEEIAAYQWETTNRTVLTDLEALPRERWTAVSYAELRAGPRAAVERLCAFCEIEFDAALASRLAGSLPLSRYTLTPPDESKWLANEAAIVRVLPSLEATWQRLRSL
jgi:hypothetical protein